jgi:chromosomal replication initiator protein
MDGTIDLLSRFVQLPENRSAFQAVVDLTTGGRPRLPLLFLHGPPGSGKSQLVAGLVERLTRSRPTSTSATCAAADLGRAVLQSPLDRSDVIREVTASDLLVVEDVQHLPAAGAGQLAQILDRRQARRKPVVVTAGCGPTELECTARLKGRFVAGLVTGIHPLDEPSRRELAAHLCDRRGLRVTDDVIGWLARHPGGARPILGDISRLEQLAKVHAPPLTLALITAELTGPPADGSLMEQIIDLVAGRFRVPAKVIRGRSRTRGAVRARHAAMFLGRRLGLPLAEIGRHLGGRDHTTVMHGYARLEAALVTDSRLAGELRDLRAAAGST